MKTDVGLAGEEMSVYRKAVALFVPPGKYMSGAEFNSLLGPQADILEAILSWPDSDGEVELPRHHELH